MIVDRYRSHGLQANPFAGGPDHERTFVDRGLGPAPARGATMLVQLIGEKGAGKSTQVREWQRRLDGPYHYVVSRPYRGRWKRPPVADLVYGDEIDRMPTLLRRRWFRALAAAEATVVVGTHSDLSSVAERAGLRVVTHELGGANRDLVRRVLEARVQSASLASAGAADQFRLTDCEIDDIHQRCAGSLRTAEVLAHELVASRVARPIPAAVLATGEQPRA